MVRTLADCVRLVLGRAAQRLSTKIIAQIRMSTVSSVHERT
jgi:hypothetical protein